MMEKYALFDKYLRGSLSEKETDELMLLLEDEEIGRELVEYSLETKMFVDYGRKVKSKITVSSKIAVSDATVKTRRRKKRRKSFLPVLVMAALLGLAFLAYQYYLEKNRAVIAGNSVVEVERNGDFLNSADEVKEGDIVMAKQASRLTLEDGSVLDLNKGTKLQVKELVFNKVFVLKSGKLEIKAAPQQIGVLKIITTDADTEVVGTEFSVNKLKVGTLLSVQSGTVSFSNNQETLRVSEGSMVYTDSKSGMIKTANTIENIKWFLWNREVRNDPSLHFYTDFIEGRHDGILKTGEILKDSTDNYFMRNGIISFENSESFSSKKEITLFAWFKVSEPIIHGPVLTKGDSAWRMQVNMLLPHVGFGGREIRYYFDSDFQVKQNQWYMMHQVITETNVKIYINGELVTDQAVSDISLNNDQPVMIGGNSEKEGLKFRGDIGEAGLFSRKLSQKEIKEMFNSGKFTHLIK